MFNVSDEDDHFEVSGTTPFETKAPVPLDGGTDNPVSPLTPPGPSLPTAPLVLTRTPKLRPSDFTGHAVAALMNNRSPAGTFDGYVVAAMRALLGSATYKFRLSRISNMSSGASSIQLNVSCNLTQYAEGAALLTLFDECKMDSSEFVHNSVDVTAVTRIMYYIGFSPVESSVTPTSTSVSRLPGSRQFYSFQTQGKALHQVAHVQSRPWGLTADEGVSTPRICSGLNGVWSLATANTATATTVYIFYTLVTVGSFRSRG